MTRIMVTGATGSLGSALARYLIDKGADVVTLVRPGEGPGGLVDYQGRYEERIADVRDRDGLRRAMHGINRVYHLAGLAITLNRLHREMVAVNIEGAKNVAEAAREAGVERLVHTSSISAIGYPPRGEVADEDFDIARSVCRNSYMQTKRAGERAVLGVAAGGDLEVVVVNPSAVIAPYSHPRYGWASLVDMARRGRLITYPPGGVAVCAVEDLVSGELAAMESGRPGERYILSTVNLSHCELFGMVCRVVGARGPFLQAPAPLMRIGARIAQAWGLVQRDPMRSPLFVPENTELAVNELFYGTGKAQRELGFRPTEPTSSIAAVDEWLTRGGGRVHQRPGRTR